MSDAKRKLGFINGTVPKPTTTDKLADWSIVHSMLSSSLLTPLSPHLRSSILCFEDAHNLRNHLKERFSVSNGAQICHLKFQISDCKQRSVESLADYYGRLQQLWDDLTSQEVVPTCGVGGSGCPVIRFFEESRTQDHLCRFLIGLDDNYAALCSTILAQDPLPIVTRAY